eukprot:UN06584
MRSLLKKWSKDDKAEHLLELLDYRYVDPELRKFAVDLFDQFDDAHLAGFLLQLVQCLKFELRHLSHLSQFLIRRALKNPYQIGHYLFWHLKAEFHELHHCERFGLMMEEYLLHAGGQVTPGGHVRELVVQQNIIDRLCTIAERVANEKNSKDPDKLKDDEIKANMKRDLERLNKDLPDRFQLPLNPRWQADGINIDGCRYMSSKKVPLWLRFKNYDKQAEDIVVMFKSGDDLRQDMLTLQIFRIMDKVWLDKGMDLRLKPYRVIATGINSDGEGVGMLQIVCNSSTVN